MITNKPCPLCGRLLDTVHLPGMSTLYGRNLPQRTLKDCYAADLAAVCSFYISSSVFEDLAKGLTPVKNTKTQWHQERKATAYAMALAFISALSGHRGAVSGANAEYLRRELDRYSPGAHELIQFYDESPGLDYAALCARSARLFEESMRRAGVKPRHDSLAMLTQMHPLVAGALAGAGAYLGTNPKRSDAPVSGGLLDFLKDVQAVDAPDFRPPVAATRRDEPTPPDADGAVIGNARRDYQLWVSRCQGFIDERRLPREHFEPLIPSPDDADHTLRDPERWIFELNRIYPGRNEWLATEGVRSDDIHSYWGAPAWVQKFQAALVEEEFRLQVKATVMDGTDMADAIATALFFLPTFTVASPNTPDYRRVAQLPLDSRFEKPGLLPEPLPFELFPRINRFLAQHTGREVEQLIMNNSLRAMNQLCRLQIQRGDL